jgi:type IV pilus assembly protein PilM
MLGNIFKFKPKKVLGIDIGTSSIKVVELSRRGKTKKLENYGELGTLIFNDKPFRVFEKDTLFLSDQDIAKAIQIICEEAGIQIKEAVFSIPDFCSFFTSFQLPVMDEEEINEAIRYEVRSYIPVPLSEVTLDWVITEGTASKTPLKILVVAVLNDVITQYQKIADLAGLKVKILEPETFALARSSVRKEDAKKIISLIDIGARSTTCNILEQGVLKISYSFNMGSNELTQLLAKSLNIGYNKAEVIKRKRGLILESDDTGEKNIKEILLPLLDSIIREIKKTFRDFYTNEGKEIEKIILGGGIALMPGLKDYLAGELQKEVEITNPFWNIVYLPLLEEVLRKKGPSYAIAVGLASKGFE